MAGLSLIDNLYLAAQPAAWIVPALKQLFQQMLYS
jgi:hypothetical protein